MTMHISPTSNDADAYVARTGVRPIVHFDRLGILGPHLLLAHAVWLDDEEVELVRSTGTAVASCPWAYLHHGQGMTRDGQPHAHASRRRRRRAGLRRAERQRRRRHPRRRPPRRRLAKDAAIDPTSASAYDGLEMATIGGAPAAGMADASARRRSARRPTSWSTTAARRSGARAATRCSS